MADSLWILSFGKYNGVEIEEVPDSYLNWLRGEKWFKDQYSKECIIVNKELKFRDQFDKHIK